MTSYNKTDPAPSWDIESIFPGGSKSGEFAGFRKQTAADLKEVEDSIDDLAKELNDQTRSQWVDWILNVQELGKRIHQASAFTTCLTGQDVDDMEAMKIQTEIQGYWARYSKLFATIESLSLKQTDEEWRKLIDTDKLKECGFFLNEMRQKARDKMPEAQEKLALDLAVNGYHAWRFLYDKIAGDLRVEIEEDGKKKGISLGQNENRFSDPDRAVRRDAFEKMESAWETRADYAAMALNSLIGFRLSIYENRRWDSFLKEAIDDCRMKEETLEAMWQAVSEKGPRIKEYVDAKTELLGIDKFRWYDQLAPVGSTNKTYSFAEAGDFIVEHLGDFSDEIGRFTRNAIDKRWIEAEDRAGKKGGAWCSSVPLNKESRIFMTFSGTYDSLSTLAHELGHAYHNYVLKDRPPMARSYPMTLAETASIFNELRVGDAALNAAGTKDEKLMLLDQKLQNGLRFFCNIRARFLFDTRYHRERKDGSVSRERLNELMTDAQKEAFFGIIDDDGLHPLFWCSKLHFYLTYAPFYNFPYTFGFLFANGVYDRAVREGRSFADSYRALLADTGVMRTEEVALKHLGADLTETGFWNDAVDRVLADVDKFKELCQD